MSDDRPIVIYSVGLVAMSLCAKEGVSREDIERQANREQPTGVGPWQISDEAFATGESNPTPCNDDSARLHYLLHC